MVKVIHVMPDGTERDSLKGLELPYNEQTASVYKFIVEFAERKQNEKILTNNTVC